jgi:putative ABC transport system ATP-binding protein
MLLGGLERATGGSVHALGHDLTTLDEDALLDQTRSWRQRIAALPSEADA